MTVIIRATRTGMGTAGWASAASRWPRVYRGRKGALGEQASRTRVLHMPLGLGLGPTSAPDMDMPLGLGPTSAPDMDMPLGLGPTSASDMEVKAVLKKVSARSK